MSKMATQVRWTIYGVAMILCGAFPFVRMFVLDWWGKLIYAALQWMQKAVDLFDRGFYGFYIGDVRISTETFWVVYMFLMSAPFVIYGIVCIVQAQRKAMQTHTLAQSISVKTVIVSALCGIAIGIALACFVIGMFAWPTSSARYPLDEFCGKLGAVVFYILATVLLIIYAHARRRPFVKKGLLFEVGVALVGVLVGAWLLSVAYSVIEVWEDTHGYINTFVEWIQSKEIYKSGVYK